MRDTSHVVGSGAQVFCPKRHVPEEELLVMRSWGVFVLAVASIVHAAPTFPLEAQQVSVRLPNATTFFALFL
jgi:hypothetical protein